MKYIKLLMLLAVSLPLFTSCSEDDDVNTVAECTVGFENTDITVSELDGYVKIPIAVSGRRNGPVRLTVEAASTGTNGAVEGENFTITDKTLNLNADTLSTGTINVEVKVIDDRVINDDRQFTLTITSAQGADITTQQTTVTITDNDGDFYAAFAGTWTLKAKNSSDADVTKDIEIVAYAEGSPDYEKILDASSAKMLNLGGLDMDFSWRFRYSFDKTSMTGTLGFICGETVASYASVYEWQWAVYDETIDDFGFDDFTATWTLKEDGTIPDTITFPAGEVLYVYNPSPDPNMGGWWEAIYDITLSRK